MRIFPRIHTCSPSPHLARGSLHDSTCARVYESNWGCYSDSLVDLDVPSTRGHGEQTAFDSQELTDVKQAVAEGWQRKPAETSILVHSKRLVHASLLVLGGIVTTLLDRQVPQPTVRSRVANSADRIMY